MSSHLSGERAEELSASLESRRSTFERMAQCIGPIDIMLDVGCGEGALSLKIAEIFKPQRLILVDIDDCLEVALPSHAEFCSVDVCSGAFFERFYNQPKLVLCSQAIHEVSNPLLAAENLLSVVPVGGFAIVFDFSEEGIRIIGEEVNSLSLANQKHYQSDLDNMARHGLQTDRGIEEFWKKKIFPKFSGETHLAINGEMYMAGFCRHEDGCSCNVHQRR